MEAKPLLFTWVHRKERYAAPCAHAPRRKAVIALTFHNALPAAICLSVLVLITRGQEGLRPPLGQA